MRKRMMVVATFILGLCLGGCHNKSSSIGIIGGADGPTAIFVTSKINWPSVYGLLGVIIAAILVTLIIYFNKKKK